MKNNLLKSAGASLILAISGCSTDNVIENSSKNTLYCEPKDTNSSEEEAAAVAAMGPCYDKEFRDNHQFSEAKRVAISINILGIEGVPIENIIDATKKSIEALNVTFKKTGLQFFVAAKNIQKDNGEIKKIFQNEISSETCDKLTKLLHTKTDPDAIQVNILPQCADEGGQTPLSRFPVTMYYYHPYTDFPIKHSYPAPEGHFGHTYWLPHEFGHRFGLLHPFTDPYLGDGIESTTDYYRTCSDQPNLHRPPPTEQKLIDGTCMVSCIDGCYSAPANIMDYNFCGENIPATFTPEQEDIMRCNITTDKKGMLSFYKEGLDSTLPEIDL